ncbi:MAG TPA: FAD-dependent oxidoreductase [Polyangiaceae bacterium]|nr:FAD-dependent oxidoreductase [Polyangiaceae bacterium]
MAIVIGAGVSGLSSAVALLEAGHAVDVWARERVERTTSAVAGALWLPFLAAPPELVARWALASLERFAALAGRSDTGVERREVVVVLRRPGEAPPAWAEALPSFRLVGPAELPPGARAAWAIEAPVIDMRRYLAWLEARVGELGGRIEGRDVASLDEALARAELVVNCAGLGARELCGDHDLHPVRGQIVRSADPGVRGAFVDDDAPGGVTYVIPRGGECVLGGSVEPGRSDREVDEREADAIVRRASAFDARLAAAPRRSAAAGLRPARSRVRLEAEPRPGGRLLVHNYGHGGSGVTLSWGCAADVVALAGGPAGAGRAGAPAPRPATPRGAGAG